MEDNFWTRVKLHIKAHRMSRKEFAEYTGIPGRTFESWIRRNCIPDATRACVIAQALGVTVEYLIMGIDDFNAEDRMKRVEERKSATEEIIKLALKICNETERLR